MQIPVCISAQCPGASETGDHLFRGGGCRLWLTWPAPEEATATKAALDSLKHLQILKGFAY